MTECYRKARLRCDSLRVRTIFIALLLVGCSKERVTLSIDGVSATVPASYVPIDPERVAALREAARNSDPDVDVSMAGRKPADAALPWMYLQRTSARPHLREAQLIKQVLEKTITELKTALAEGGLEIVSTTSTIGAQSHEVCFVTKAKQAPKALNHTCMQLWVDRQNQFVSTASVVCLSTIDAPEECQRIIESRRFNPSQALSLDQTFGTPQR